MHGRFSSESYFIAAAKLFLLLLLVFIFADNCTEQERLREPSRRNETPRSRDYFDAIRPDSTTFGCRLV